MYLPVPVAFLAFLCFLLGAIEELTRGAWGVFTPLAFGLIGLACIAIAWVVPHLWPNRRP